MTSFCYQTNILVLQVNVFMYNCKRKLLKVTLCIELYGLFNFEINGFCLAYILNWQIEDRVIPLLWNFPRSYIIQHITQFSSQSLQTVWRKNQIKSQIFLSLRVYRLLERDVLLDPRGVCAADKNKQCVYIGSSLFFNTETTPQGKWFSLLTRVGTSYG